MQEDSDVKGENRSPKRKHRRGLTRIAAACERCRRRKQKCDEKFPVCGPCALAGAKCILSDRLTVVAQSSPDADEALQDEIRHLRAQVTELSQRLTQEKERITPASSSHGVGPGTNSPWNSIQNPTYRTLSTNQVSSGVNQTESSFEQGYHGRILRPTFGNTHPSSVDAGDMSSAWSLWKDDHSAETPFEYPRADDIASHEDHGLALIDVFFEQRWVHLPILHKPTFLREVFGPFARGELLSGVARLQLFMVFAVAALEQDRVKGKHSYSHRDLFNIAIRDLNSVLASEDPECITSLLLLCMYGRTEPQSVNMWHTTGLALRIAVGVDLHRAESIRHMNLMQAEMSKRLFWSVYAMDRSTTIYLGRPLGIQDADISLPFPLQLTDEDLEVMDHATVLPRSRVEVKDMSTFIHLIKLRQTNAEIYRIFHSVHGNHLTASELDRLRQEFYSQLNEWLIGAPRYSFTASMFQSPEWFQIAYHLAVISLNRPSYVQPTPSIEALRVCADSSISLISCYGALYAKNKVSYSFVLLSAIFMAAVTMLYALRASPQVREDLTKQVVETNINTCLMLLRGISSGREVAEKARHIIQELGKAVLSLFDTESPEEMRNSASANKEKNVDREFLSWFGLKSRMVKPSLPADVQNEQMQLQNFDNFGGTDEPLATLSVDVAWEDLFAQGFGMDNSTGMDFFPHSGF